MSAHPHRPSQWWDILEAWSPAHVRLCARRPEPPRGRKYRRYRGVEASEIAILAEIPLARVQEISQAYNWDDVTVREMRAIFAACGFDPTSPKDRALQYRYLWKSKQRKLTKPPAYLTRHPAWETEFLPLIELMRSRRNSSVESENTSSPAAPRY